MRWSIVLASLVLVSYVSAHSWMVDPVPRSGGGLSTANAATNGPCGKNGGVTTVTNYNQAATITVGVRRANAHGPTASAAFSYCTGTNGDLSTCFGSGAVFTPISGAGALAYSVATTDTQNLQVTLPAALTGNAVLQFVGTLGGSSKWFDCAYIKVGSQASPNNPCLTNNGGCSAKATCTLSATNQAVCTCTPGYYGNGKGANGCTALPADVPVNITIALDSTSPSAGVSFQDQFNQNIAFILGVSPSRVSYDSAIKNGTTYIVALFMVADPTSGESGKVLVDKLLNLVGNGDTSLNQLSQSINPTNNFGGVVGASSSTTVVTFGGGAPSSGSSDDSTAIGVGVGLTIPIVVIGAIVAAYMYKKRTSKSTSYDSSNSTYNHNNTYASSSSSNLYSVNGTPAYPSAVVPSASAKPANTYSPNTATYASSTSRPLPSPAPNTTTNSLPRPAQPEWGEHLDAQGHKYYFNYFTGSSTWERPQGVYIEPLKQ